MRIVSKEELTKILSDLSPRAGNLYYIVQDDKYIIFNHRPKMFQPFVARKLDASNVIPIECLAVSCTGVFNPFRDTDNEEDLNGI